MKSAAGLSYMTRADERAQDTLPLGNTPKVFISYKKDEKKQVTDEGLLYTRDLAAKRVVNLSDCAVWHDGLLTPGGDYNTEIRSAILECDAVVLLLTSNVLTSKYIWDIEIKLAKENNKIIIPNTAPQPEPAAAPLSKNEAKAALKAQKALEKQMAKEAKAAAKEAKKQARGR